MNAVVLVICRSMRRLQVAEARGRGLTDMEHPHQHHGRELDDLYRAAGKMTHDERLARLAELGEPIDDLALPEPPR